LDARHDLRDGRDDVVDGCMTAEGATGERVGGAVVAYLATDRLAAYGGRVTEVLVQPASERSAVRRAVPLSCEAVSLDRYRMLGRRILDLSETGLLLAADELGRLNEVVLVHLFAGDAEIV